MIEAEIKTYLLTIPRIRNIVGRHIYSGRIPTNERPMFALKIRRLSADRFYVLTDEDKCVQPTLQIDGMSRTSGADVRLDELMEYVRLALNAFTQAPGDMGDTFTSSFQIVRDSMDLPIEPEDDGAGWRFRRSFDCRFTHDQLVRLSEL